MFWLYTENAYKHFFVYGFGIDYYNNSSSDLLGQQHVCTGQSLGKKESNWRIRDEVADKPEWSSKD